MLSGFFRFSAAQLRETLQYLRAAALVDLHHIRYKGIGCIALCVGFYTLGNAFFYAAALFPRCKACAVIYAAGEDIFPVRFQLALDPWKAHCTNGF